MVNPSATPRARPRTWADLPKVDPAVHLAALIVMYLDPFINFKLREYFWYIVWNFVVPELSEDIPYFSFTPQFPLWNAQFDDLHDDNHMDHLDELPVEKDLEEEDEKDLVEPKLDEDEPGDLEEVDDEEIDDKELDEEDDDGAEADIGIMVDDEDSDVEDSSETDPLNITSRRARNRLVAAVTVSVATINNMEPRGVKRRRIDSPEADNDIPVASGSFPIPEASPEARSAMHEVFSSDLPDSDQPPNIDPKEDSPDAESLLRHFLTDFAGVFKPPETSPWIPVIVEIKRRTRQDIVGVKKAEDLSPENGEYLRKASKQAENQANYLFQSYPQQPKVLAIAGVGDIWTWRMCVRGDPSDIARKEASRDDADCPSDANFPSTDSRHITSSQSEIKESEWSDLYVLQTEASDNQLQEVKEEVRTLINTFLELIDGIDPEEGERDSEEEDGDDDDSDDSN
ncbi:hypothetical protein C8J56DRAFT_962558 [Mycena floridula]|nr:hypothetical protein C8J56DRAFT_962558 [Mycena floridula]